MSEFVSKKIMILLSCVAGTVFAVAIAVMLHNSIDAVRSGELGTKDVYSFLQGIEFEHRNDQNKIDPIFINRLSDAGYIVLGLATNDPAFPRTWIVLNKTAPDGTVIMVPAHMECNVNCNFVANLSTRKSIDPHVLSYLKSICTNK